MKKIPLEYLAAYLPYKVQAKFKETEGRRCKTYVIGTVDSVYNDSTITCFDTVNAAPLKFKLLLKPMSAFIDDDFKDIRLNTAEYLKWVNFYKYGLGNLEDLSYKVIQRYLKHHYDIFELINQGLAEPKL